MTGPTAILDAGPGPGEVPEYYRRYLGRQPRAGMLEALGGQLAQTLRAADGIGDPDHRYAPGKWSVKEVLVHVTDTERVFAYRALRIARGDGTPLPGFEQDDYVRPDDLALRAMEDVKAELRAVREATIALFRGLTDEALLRTGTASGVTFTPRGIAWIIAGHELHHRAILEERYR